MSRTADIIHAGSWAFLCDSNAKGVKTILQKAVYFLTHSLTENLHLSPSGQLKHMHVGRRNGKLASRVWCSVGIADASWGWVCVWGGWRGVQDGVEN